jgi:hypothetical protein
MNTRYGISSKVVSEEEYFYSLNQELIERMRSEQEAATPPTKQRANESAS